MDPTTLQTIADWCGGRLEHGDPGLTVTQLCTDSRQLQPGDLFLALRGENFDAHDFLPQAASRGAAAAIGETAASSVPFIRVDNSLAALQKLAAAYRRSLALKVIGITGSSGKTTTKDFTAAVLGSRFSVTKTEGNLNNHIGLPTTILRATSTHQWAVWEMGMNHPGEIAPLAALAAPDVAIITNIGTAHIEFLKTRAAIAQEKGMLAEAIGEEGFVILPTEDDFTDSIAARTSATVIRAGLLAGDVRGSNLHGSQFTITADGETAVATLHVPGEHMVRNALLAVAAGSVAGLSLAEGAAGLATVQLTKGRLEQKVIHGVQVLDDSYNANPESMVAALRTLAQIPTGGSRIAILGRMGELGWASEQSHRRVGAAAAAEHIHCVVSVGDDAALISEAARAGGVPRAFHVGSNEEATALLASLVTTGDAVLVKGSRAARMETIIEGFAAR